jgi:pyruvate dehydrogenase E1 component alpha subunit
MWRVVRRLATLMALLLVAKALARAQDERANWGTIPGINGTHRGQGSRRFPLSMHLRHRVSPDQAMMLRPQAETRASQHAGAGIHPGSARADRVDAAPGAASATDARGRFMATPKKNAQQQEPATAPDTSAADSTQEGQAQVQYDADALLGFYQKMVEIRLFEDAAGRGFRQGKIGGYLHVYSGQEPIALGFIEHLKEGDRTITAYRDHAHALLQGADPNAVMAELYGKGTGLVKGKGGSMHLFHVEGGMYGGYGIVGGHIPLGVGMAFGLRYRGEPGIVQLYFGDGSIHNGAFHEAANLAGLWGKDGHCPVLFILENNQYGMGTSVERATAMTELGKKFESYGIEWERIDGMDIEAVLEAAARATERVRETGKPYAIEAFTYRLVPHGAADFLEKYRSKEEVKKWREKDPIGTLEHKLVEMGVEESRLEEIRAKAREMADAAVKFAEESPEPDLSELTTDVYTPDVEVATAG